MSFPTRERGLKFPCIAVFMVVVAVVPHAGTWIEMIAEIANSKKPFVVPHAGTWIEIDPLRYC